MMTCWKLAGRIIIFSAMLLIASAGQLNAMTFSDNFKDAVFTDANWKVLQYGWKMTPEGYHGSGGPVGSNSDPGHPGERETAASAAWNSRMFYNNGMIIETVFRIDSDSTVRRSAGIGFSAYQTRSGGYSAYGVELVYNLTNPVPGFDLVLDDGSGTMPHLSKKLTGISFDVFYKLKVVFTDSINVYLYDEGETKLFGSFENISPTLPLKYGIVAILTQSEATFKSFTMTGIPVIGDVNGDTKTDLADVVTALRISAGISVPADRINYDACVNGDGKIGPAEAMFVQQILAGLRPGPPIVDTTADDAAIRAVFARTKTAMEAHNLTDLMSLYAADYLNDGTDRVTQQSDLSYGVPKVGTFDYTISNITVTGTKATVVASVTITFNDGQPPLIFPEVSETDDVLGGMLCLTKTNDQWLFWGNQRRGEVNVPTFRNEDGSYSFRPTAEGEDLTAATISGPNIQPTILNWDDGWEEFNAWVTPSTTPHVGDVYSLSLTYADGHNETLTDTIKSLVTVSPQLTASIGANNTINLSWDDISSQVPNADHYWILVYGPGYRWYSEDLSLSRTSATVNEDGTASGPLVQGESYGCTLYLCDKFGDASQSGVNVRIP
jgi:hypothetical protein